MLYDVVTKPTFRIPLCHSSMIQENQQTRIVASFPLLVL